MSPKSNHLILALSLSLLAGCRSIFTKTSYPEFVFTTANLQHNKDDASLIKGIPKKIIIENLAGHVNAVSSYWRRFMQVTVYNKNSCLRSFDYYQVNHIASISMSTTQTYKK